MRGVKPTRLVIGVVLSLGGCVAPGGPERPAPPALPSPAPTMAVPPAPSPKIDLHAEIDRLGRSFDGRVGISVRDLNGVVLASFNPSSPMPQQSVSKLWVALSVLDAVDRGALHLDDPVTVKRADLTLFHQPIRDLVNDAGYPTTIRELLQRALTTSDNTANDVLLWRLGGPPVVRAVLQAKALTGIGFGPGERQLQSGTAGLTWRQDYSIEDAFFVARNALPPDVRVAALQRYLASPPDGASADGISAALARLAGGSLLSPASTALMLGWMEESHTGPQRIRGGLAPGWSFAHKTGTGQELAGLATGYNDVGLLTGPSGQRYIIAVLIAKTRQPIPVRQAMMSGVSRAVIAASTSP